VEAKTYSSWYFHFRSKCWVIIDVIIGAYLLVIHPVEVSLDFFQGERSKTSFVIYIFIYSALLFFGLLYYFIITKLKIVIENNVVHFRKKTFWPLWKGFRANFSCDELSKIIIKAEKKSIYSPIIKGFTKSRYGPFLLLEIPGQQIGFYPLEVMSVTEEKSFRAIKAYTKERYNSVQEEMLDLLDKSEIFFQLKHRYKNAEIVFDEKIYDKRIQKW
jgi:hypothetical protein